MKVQGYQLKGTAEDWARRIAEGIGSPFTAQNVFAYLSMAHAQRFLHIPGRQYDEVLDRLVGRALQKGKALGLWARSGKSWELTR